jgi:hypothetical protein
VQVESDIDIVIGLKEVGVRFKASAFDWRRINTVCFKAIFDPFLSSSMCKLVAL